MTGQYDRQTAEQLLERMFAVEFAFMRDGKGDVGPLARAFHADVVVHEPASLPYPGDWVGLEGVGALMRRMGEVWSDMRLETMQAARAGDTVFMSAMLHLKARANGAEIEQPFAEVLRFRDGLLLEGTPFYYDTSAIVAALG